MSSQPCPKLLPVSSSSESLALCWPPWPRNKADHCPCVLPVFSSQAAPGCPQGRQGVWWARSPRTGPALGFLRSRRGSGFPEGLPHRVRLWSDSLRKVGAAPCILEPGKYSLPSQTALGHRALSSPPSQGDWVWLKSSSPWPRQPAVVGHS